MGPSYAYKRRQFVGNTAVREREIMQSVHACQQLRLVGEVSRQIVFAAVAVIIQGGPKTAHGSHGYNSVKS